MTAVDATNTPVTTATRHSNVTGSHGIPANSVEREIRDDIPPPSLLEPQHTENVKTQMKKFKLVLDEKNDFWHQLLRRLDKNRAVEQPAADDIVTFILCRRRYCHIHLMESLELWISSCCVLAFVPFPFCGSIFASNPLFAEYHMVRCIFAYFQLRDEQESGDLFRLLVCPFFLH